MVGGARVRGQRFRVRARARGQRAGVCAARTAVKWSPSCFLHFTLARFCVRSKGKCSCCKRLAEYCYSASNLGKFYVRSKGKCIWCKSLAEYRYSASNLGKFYVRSKVEDVPLIEPHLLSHIKPPHETPASNTREFYVSCGHVKSCHDWIMAEVA